MLIEHLQGDADLLRIETGQLGKLARKANKGYLGRLPSRRSILSLCMRSIFKMLLDGLANLRVLQRPLNLGIEAGRLLLLFCRLGCGLLAILAISPKGIDVVTVIECRRFGLELGLGPALLSQVASSL